MTNLTTVLRKLKSVRLKLHKDKCQFFQDQVSYLGFTLDAKGLKKNIQRNSCIMKAPVPNNVSEVRAFTGMVNYYSKFVDQFDRKIHPLYELLKKHKDSKWTEDCQVAYKAVKNEISSDNILVLVHFNSNKENLLTTDAFNTTLAGKLGSDLLLLFQALQASERNSTIERRLWV